MRIEFGQSGHWTDEQLIDYLYGVGPSDGHLDSCAHCAARLSAMDVRRKRLSLNESVSDSLLAAQRRTIYARLSEPRRWWRDLPLGRFAAAAATLVVLAGTLTVYENHRRALAESRSDAQLAQEVSQMSFESESAATAPLKGLFVQ